MEDFRKRYYKTAPTGTGENAGKNQVHDNYFLMAEMLEKFIIALRENTEEMRKGRLQ